MSPEGGEKGSMFTSGSPVGVPANLGQESLMGETLPLTLGESSPLSSVFILRLY